MEDEKNKKSKKNKKKKNNKQQSNPNPNPNPTAPIPPPHQEGKEDNGVSNGDEPPHPEEVAWAPAAPQYEEEKLQWLQKEAAFQATIQQLQSEIDFCEQNQGNLERMVREVRDENDLHSSKQASLEETIKQLTNVNRSWLQKEAAFDEHFRKLRDENVAHQQKEDVLENKVNQLLDEKVVLTSNMASLEEKVKQLENVKDSWTLKETTTEVTLTKMKVDIARLQMQVVELEDSRNSLLKGNQQLVETLAGLEESRNSLLRGNQQLVETVAVLEESRNSLLRGKQELVETVAGLEESRNSLLKGNQQLVETVAGLEESKKSLLADKQQLLDSISELQLQLQNLQTGNSYPNASNEVQKDDLISQIEAASTLVDRLIVENAELVEKVNELYRQLDQRSALPVSDVGNDPDPAEKAEIPSETVDTFSETNESSPMLGQTLENFEIEPAGVLQLPSESESGEIVQIPLEDDQTHALQQQAITVKGKDDIPLSDAPLIGAPFRLISFVAKYVSGADLVNKDALT